MSKSPKLFPESFTIFRIPVRRSKVVTLVDQMLTLHAQVAAAKPGHARTVLERQIAPPTAKSTNSSISSTASPTKKSPSSKLPQSSPARPLAGQRGEGRFILRSPAPAGRPLSAYRPAKGLAGPLCGIYNPRMQYEFFDPASEVTIYYDRLPHWDQPGVMCFLTWRTIDSIPEATIRRWQVERAGWLRRHGIDPQAEGWREQLRSQSPTVRREYHEHFTSPWMECLDACHGECVLRQPALSLNVAENLLHADGDEYELSDFVVMPNHVHALAQFRSDGAMKRCCRDWKHYTARRIHDVLGRRGHFWQTESFDHLVRSPAQFEYLRDYIARNPVAARLQIGEYRHYRK